MHFFGTHCRGTGDVESVAILQTSIDVKLKFHLPCQGPCRSDDAHMESSNGDWRPCSRSNSDMDRSTDSNADGMTCWMGVV
ncbi:hypothetical protein VFPPC_15386 [Pochonia chlamydosporia 170]|uniref:Uncharacterized protein n=1 Tax=Pochonia chlamydosporia 170 TaxID=1380566 RepID=A0A179G935_METCM|nr:hypothetical protein VFPPC_15386 [Pochonia chlamydosporia 170]OAQ73931.1 hypothetical protein VFPPC_15386 [Pochonia chlamydosporia 170]